jgi:hypothetical protein
MATFRLALKEPRMARLMSHSAIRATIAVVCVLLLPYANFLAIAQSHAQYAPQAASQPPPPQFVGPDQLDSLVAPIALYPDPLLSQVLAASTYPLEIIEAQQWLQQNRNLQGQSLIEAAQQQNWDPSVQVLVAFPDVVALLSRDVRWTTNLGNAFLAQQADVMNAIQRLRSQASNNGRLASTPQQIVTTETQDEQSAIQIQPVDPQVIYPPVYDPAYVWGPPVSGGYPAVSYPQGGNGAGFGSGSDYGGGSGFGQGISLAGLFSGLLGWGGWGWALNWFTHTLSLNGLFFNALFGSHNFNGGFNSGGGYGAPSFWAHNPAHRLGVPYSNGFLAARYQGAEPGGRFSSPRLSASSFAHSGFAGSGSPAWDGWRRFGAGDPALSASSSAGWRGSQPGNRMAESYNRAGAPSYRSGFASNGGGGYPQNYRSYTSPTPQRMSSNFRSGTPFDRGPAPMSHFATPRMPSQQFVSQNFGSRSYSTRQDFSMPRASPPHFSAPHFSAPRFSAPRGSSHFSAPRRSGGGHSGGAHSGKGSHKH